PEGAGEYLRRRATLKHSEELLSGLQGSTVLILVHVLRNNQNKVIRPVAGSLPLQASDGREIAATSAVASRLKSKARGSLTVKAGDDRARFRGSRRAGRNLSKATVLEFPTTPTW